jgi:hypothetical protein
MVLHLQDVKINSCRCSTTRVYNVQQNIKALVKEEDDVDDADDVNRRR